MSNKADNLAPQQSHQRGGRSAYPGNGSGGGSHHPPFTTTAGSSALPGGVSASSISSSAQAFAPSPIGAARHVVPPPRSCMAGGSTRNSAAAAATASPRHSASPYALDDFDEESSFRSGQPAGAHFQVASAAASSPPLGKGTATVPFARYSTPSTGDGGGTNDPTGATSINVMSPRPGKFTPSLDDSTHMNSKQNRNSNGSYDSGSDGARRRTSAPTGSSGGGGGMSFGLGHTLNDPMHTATTLHHRNSMSAAPMSTGGSTGNSDGGIASRHLQPPSNHSRVNLFVRDLPLDLREDQLRAMFTPFGEIVNSAIMRNIHTGVSLGTAFVRYSQHAEAMRAMEAFAGGRAGAGPRRVTVQWARREHDKAPAGAERRRMRKLFIRNVPKDITPEMLIHLFSRFGPVKTVSTHRDTAAANAVTQPNSAAAAAAGESIEQVLDVPVSAGSLPAAPTTTTTIATAHGSNEDRRIAFVTFEIEGVAEQATAAIHNTLPFASCNGIPLMVKLAEDTPVRHNSTLNNSSNVHFSSGGTAGGTASAATVSTGTVGGHTFNAGGQPSHPGVSWGDAQSNEYLHSPTTSPLMMQLNTHTGVGAAAATAPPSTWRANAPSTVPQGGFPFGSPEGLRPQSSSNSTMTAATTTNNSVAATLSAPRAFNSAVMSNIPTPTNMSFNGITQMNSANTNAITPTMTPYATHSAGVASLRQHPPPVPGVPPLSSSHNAYAAAAAVVGSLSKPSSLEAREGPSSPSQQPPSSSSHPIGTSNNAAAGAQTSLQDLCCLGYMVSSNDLCTFPATTSASPEMLGLATGAMAMLSYDPQDYYALSASYGSRGISGSTPVPTHPPLPSSQAQSTAPSANADSSPRNVSSSLNASPSPALPSPGTLSFFQTSPRFGHNSAQPSTMQVLPMMNAAVSSSPVAPVQQPKLPMQLQAELYGSNHTNHSKGPSPSAMVVPPAPRSAAAAAAAANRGSTLTNHQRLLDGRAMTGGIRDSGGGSTFARLQRSDLAAGPQSTAGRRASGPNPSGVAGVPTASLTTLNPAFASSFSSPNIQPYQPFEVTSVFGTGVRGTPPPDSNCISSRSSLNNVGASAPAGPGSLRTAPPTLPKCLPLPPGGAPTALITAAAPVRPAYALPVTAGLAAGGSTGSALSLENTLAPFDYDDDKDAEFIASTKSRGSSSYAAELLRAVTEGTVEGSLGISPTHPTSATTTAIADLSAPGSTSGTSRDRRRSFTSPSGMFAYKDSSDGEGKVSNVSSATRPTGTQADRRSASSSKPTSLTMGAPAFLDEQLLYQWDGTTASAPGSSNSASPAGAIGSQAPSPVAGSNQSKSRNVFTLMSPPPPRATSITHDPTAPTSASNLWLTTDPSPYWNTAQMKDPLTLLPAPRGIPHVSTSGSSTTATTTTAAAAGTEGERGSRARVPLARVKSSGDFSHCSPAPTLPGTALPRTTESADEDDEQTGWGTYPDLTMNFSWAAGVNDEAPRSGHDGATGVDPVLYSHQMGDDAERLYNFMTYDDSSY
ncbi:putative RNA binding protein [Leptomonas pyrrhocoris]|uniref:Putative RNA binding protein n=1 Tax=Leptomonas pyrrhocoris TaxID=157538 RepID=A0A0N0VFB3_LEPPY|nr:putative RNA binding protein [Leptomonas pyrrhocoris]KPA80502.1 putative RNA binding protein [Leptomonas pyrrhocoris]|eukprot:XP_015658941.1 putative RNA binding protein [Leptomonas pyrrhocoris]